MNKKYWEKFYKKHKIIEPTLFAKFALNYIPKKVSILDIGCGAGRDSYYFGKNGMKVLGIDFAICPNKIKNVNFKRCDINTLLKTNNNFDVIYSRFFLHAITNTNLKNLIKWSKGLFIAECRTKGDKPLLYKNHKRNFIDGNDLIKQLILAEFDILYYKKGYDMAIRKTENPLIVRIIAYKGIK